MEALEVTIVPLAAGMAAELADIAAAAPDPWRQEDLERAATDGTCRCFAALCEKRPVGFACFLAVGDSADLQLVAVEPALRRKGVAQTLLRHAFVQLNSQGVRQVLLEARASNLGAIALYRCLGFALLADRPGMYAHPKEDGVLMGLILGAETETEEANV